MLWWTNLIENTQFSTEAAVLTLSPYWGCQLEDRTQREAYDELDLYRRGAEGGIVWKGGYGEPFSWSGDREARGTSVLVGHQ